MRLGQSVCLSSPFDSFYTTSSAGLLIHSSVTLSVVSRYGIVSPRSFRTIFFNAHLTPKLLRFIVSGSSILGVNGDIMLDGSLGFPLPDPI